MFLELLINIYKKTKKTFKFIFDIYNKDDKKIINFFGFKFKFKKNKKYLKVCQKKQIINNKIVFCNFLGKSYGCNPKYIAEEIIKRNLPYELIWLISKKSFKKNFPQNIRLVNVNSEKAWKELASAKLWISNCRMNMFFRKGLFKKEHQYYIQTWHGSLGIKKLDADVQNFIKDSNKSWVSQSKIDSQNMDYLISNSLFESRILPKAMWFNNKVQEYGHPRNDIFFNNNEQIIRKIKNYYKINENYKIALYVPSFRDDQNLDWYTINYDRILNSLNNKFGHDWVFLARLHPKIKYFKLKQKNKNIINATDYPDIQELLVASDIAITDYSSCIFDFMLSRKPAFIYATDIEKYNNERGFYYPLDSTPFPIATNNDEMIENIENFNYEQYKIDVEKFLEEKGCMEDGKASERVVDLIEEIIGK